jgi:steroid 5-alpha reductase family enzyme
MKIITTATLLIVTLIVVPVFSYFFGKTPGEEEYRVITTLLYIMLGVAAYCFMVGELTQNNSQVDKLWSIVPIVYVWTMAAYGDFAPRLVIMSLLVTVWGARLTANFALKGAYHWKFWQGEEDYRWQVLRKRPEFNTRWKWALFNLFFICCYQNILILLFTLPGIVAMQYREVPLSLFDYIITALMLIFIVFEAIADQQQWNFQSKKCALLKTGQPLPEAYSKGFLDKGLWAWSRHPNYFAEQVIWVCFYFFSVAASGAWLNWSIAGCLLLMVLFQGSATFCEEISAGKYSMYKQYQKRVSRFLPLRGLFK